MKICFVLPKFARKPLGGFKMAFEYANRLYGKGYEVQILFLNDVTFKKYPIPQFVKDIASNYLTRKEPTWFALNPKIEKISGKSSNVQSKIKDADVVIATAVETVDVVKKMFPKVKKAYFIQDYEAWNGVSDEKVRATYREGFINIVISNWLKEIVDEYTSTPCVLVKNPVDINIYCCKTPLQNRRKHTISFLYHEGEHKGTKYALQVLAKLRNLYPDLQIYAFGTVKTSGLPENTRYTYCASQEQTVEIYNSSEVFLCTTIEEGYGLTGLEAMACGAALVSTDYRGVHEYATDGVNALLSPVKDVDALVSNVSKLFDNDELRYQIAESGMKSVQKDFNWDVAVDKFEKAITE